MGLVSETRPIRNTTLYWRLDRHFGNVQGVISERVIESGLLRDLSAREVGTLLEDPDTQND